MKFKKKGTSLIITNYINLNSVKSDKIWILFKIIILFLEYWMSN